MTPQHVFILAVLERATALKAKLGEVEAQRDAAETELKIKCELLAALENKPASDISGPSASAPFQDAKTSRKRGARGRFIKSS